MGQPVSSRDTEVYTNATTQSGPADRRVVAASAVVEISGFPQALHTRGYGDPDTLFVPLLDAAREACRMIERLTKHGEERAAAVRLSAMHLASVLLRDAGFSLVARGTSHENFYIVDLDAETFFVRSRLYAVVSRRTSFFKVEISGSICGSNFAVRNPLHAVIAQIEENNIRRPGFFASSLAQECLRAQMEQERFGRLDDSPAPGVFREVRLFLPVGGAKIPVFLRQKEEGSSWDIVDGRRQEWVGTLAADAEGPLSQVVQIVQKLFEHK